MAKTIGQILDTLNAELSKLEGVKFMNANEFHDELIKNSVKKAFNSLGMGIQAMAEKIEYRVWDMRCNYITLFKLKLDLKKDNRLKYDLAGKIIKVYFVAENYDKIKDMTIREFISDIEKQKKLDTLTDIDEQIKKCFATIKELRTKKVELKKQFNDAYNKGCGIMGG